MEWGFEVGHLCVNTAKLTLMPYGAMPVHMLYFEAPRQKPTVSLTPSRQTVRLIMPTARHTYYSGLDATFVGSWYDHYDVREVEPAVT